MARASVAKMIMMRKQGQREQKGMGVNMNGMDDPMQIQMQMQKQGMQMDDRGGMQKQQGSRMQPMNPMVFWRSMTRIVRSYR